MTRLSRLATLALAGILLAPVLIVRATQLARQVAEAGQPEDFERLADRFEAVPVMAILGSLAALAVIPALAGRPVRHLANGSVAWAFGFIAVSLTVALVHAAQMPQAAAYTAVLAAFIMTNVDLAWHLDAALRRLVSQQAFAWVLVLSVSVVALLDPRDDDAGGGPLSGQLDDIYEEPRPGRVAAMRDSGLPRRAPESSP